MRTFQLFSFVAVCAVASGGYINVGYSGQGAGYSGYNGVSGGYEGYYPVQVDYGHANVGGHSYHSRPKYAFDYAVSDPHTGDHKTQWETRDGDVVKGAYSVAEPDGTTRIVEYTADKIHGFQAVVKRIGHAKHPQQNYNTHGYVGYNGHY